MKQRLAIIGAGSSGLITLKTAKDLLKDWEIVCFEKSGSIQGCWGNPYQSFVSTSTKYTTQFSCFPRYDESIDPSADKDEFFKGGEYGQYLEDFADHFGLRQNIRLETSVLKVTRKSDCWRLQLSGDNQTEEFFTHLVVCTGLANQLKSSPETKLPSVSSIQEIESIRDQSVVVVGGGESAADIANRLAMRERNNQVYLSLKSGIRVSPRYHPVRGVPSDFLRNRLMLSVSADLRNFIGQKFVESRIRYQELFERVFPNRGVAKSNSTSEYRKYWDMKLTKAAKDSLFNMFHNKSDGFLDAVGDGRIQIVGPQSGSGSNVFHEFQSAKTKKIDADLVIPRIGFQSNLFELFSEAVSVRDFYLGCCHSIYKNLFLVGFARPIIGNIPTISEQQALFVVKQLDGETDRPEDIEEKHAYEMKKLEARFSHLNLDAIYPVEMFPYCDRLAKLMRTYPTPTAVGGFFKWMNIQLSPASTLHYTSYKHVKMRKVYMPALLIMVLAVIKLFDSIRTACSPRLTRFREVVG